MSALFLKLHNDQLIAVNQGGKRRGSGCAYRDKDRIFEALEEFDTPSPPPPRRLFGVKLKDLSPGRIYYESPEAHEEDYHVVCGCSVCIRSQNNPTVWVSNHSV